ncbi:DUF917 domain-containing protein [Ketobacter sp.]|uniref:DUF917 domain-containing protein n=1 Tax=Ketobacter sp. TaxID=2083498 RepID=UPI000F20C7AD|nr:DUF917 domain-containing protein [Ketobacter sp.]RLT93242.1 MAG: DUF917 family protein [Ketobacter sp.]
MYHINKEDMEIIVNGASFLASGGGGGVQSANDVIKNIVSFADQVAVAEPHEVHDDARLLVICGVGAPDAPNLNFKLSPGYGLEGLQTMTGESYHYVLPIEVGAMNSMIPLLACAQFDIPFVDADGAGRSVPQMSMCSYALRGFSTRETLVVSEEDDQYPLHPDNAEDMEAQVRNIVSTKLQDAGTVATWSLTGRQIHSPGALVPGSLAVARSIGKAMASASPLAAVQEIIATCYPAQAVILRRGKVTAATNRVQDGFDVGTVTLQEGTRQVTLYFVNESLLATIDDGSNPVAFILGPDMICSMGVDGTPMTNSEICSQFAAGHKVEITLLWVQAVDTIRVPSMFFKYLALLLQKFGEVNLTGYRFLEDVPHILGE